jgi:hypothetical protein
MDGRVSWTWKDEGESGRGVFQGTVMVCTAAHQFGCLLVHLGLPYFLCYKPGRFLSYIRRRIRQCNTQLSFVSIQGLNLSLYCVVRCYTYVHVYMCMYLHITVALQVININVKLQKKTSNIKLLSWQIIITCSFQVSNRFHHFLFYLTIYALFFCAFMSTFILS